MKALMETAMDKEAFFGLSSASKMNRVLAGKSATPDIKGALGKAKDAIPQSSRSRMSSALSEGSPKGPSLFQRAKAAVPQSSGSRMSAAIKGSSGPAQTSAPSRGPRPSRFSSVADKARANKSLANLAERSRESAPTQRAGMTDGQRARLQVLRDKRAQPKRKLRIP